MSRAEKTADRILDAALTLMAESGLHRTSIESIAVAAGVSHMTVYRRWPHKEDLITALLERESQRMRESVEHHLDGIDDRFEQFIEGFTVFFWHYYTHPLLTGPNPDDPMLTVKALTSASGPMFESLIDYLAHRLRAQAGPTPLDEDAARAFAELLIRISHSLLLTSIDTRPFVTREEVAAWGRSRLGALVRVRHGQ